MKLALDIKKASITEPRQYLMIFDIPLFKSIMKFRVILLSFFSSFRNLTSVIVPKKPSFKKLQISHA